jgi:uncharacterized phiE125 gp8 family phage protein
MPLTLLAAPGAPAMDVAEARMHVRQDGTFDDSILRGLVSAATSFAVTETQRALVAARYQLVLDSFPGNRMGVPFGRPYGLPGHAILIERSPLVQVLAVEYLDMSGVWQTMPDTDYVVVKDGPIPRITPVFGKIWPIPMPQIGSVRVTFVAGYAAGASANVSNNTVTLRNWAPLAIGDVLRVSNSGGTLPAPLQPDTDYYVQAIAAPGSYTLAESPGGAALDITTAGSGTHYAGTQVSAEPAGVIPEGIKAWMMCRLDSLYRHRGEVTSSEKMMAMPYIDRLLDPFRSVTP